MIIHGTVPDIAYQIFSKHSLTDAVWTVEQNLIGNASTNWTPTTISMIGRPTMFFRAIAYGQESDGDGLPDWWETQYGLDPNNPDTGNTGVPDGYKNPAGDGWSNLEKYQNAWNPNVFYTPRAPSGLTVTLNAGGTSATLTWQPSRGNVSGYTILRQDGPYSSFVTIGTVSANQTTFTDTSVPAFDDVEYEIIANYGSNGSSPPSEQANPRINPKYTTSASIVRGPQGGLYLVASTIPQNVVALRVYLTGGRNSFPIYDPTAALSYQFTPAIHAGYGAGETPQIVFDVPVTNFVNGVYQIPVAQASLYGYYYFSVQAVAADGKRGNQVDAISSTGLVNPNSIYNYSLGGNNNIPFLDGRQQIQQNISFLLRAADGCNPYYFNVTYPYIQTYAYQVCATTNYVYAGYTVNYPDDPNDVSIDEFRPFEDNWLYDYFVYNPSNFDATGVLNNGLTFVNGNRTVTDTANFFPTFGYVSNPSQSLLSPLLDAQSSQWIIFNQNNTYAPQLDCNGVILNSHHLTLTTGFKNIYGLTYNSILLAGGDAPNIFGPGQPTVTSGNYWFNDVQQPVLIATNYYFARPGIDPLPGQPTFSVTNQTSDTLIIPVGKPFVVTAWARQSISNGYNGVFAYPQQYFDKAYKTDASGNITTNQTGILSEYGEFFPTEPGKTILTTKPDGATGQVGQCPINVIKMQLDVNHDSTMDTTFAGPDNTSVDRPFKFWVNNDDDAAGPYGDPDVELNTPQLPDYNYSDDIYGNGKPCIHSKRDLEDYARLWICGMPALTNAGYQVTMSWGSISGNPMIRLFQAVETNGGTLYLTDTNVAAAQVAIQTYVPSTSMAYYIPGPGISIGTVSNGATFTFPTNFFTNSTTKYLLFEGASIGTGQLTLTVAQGSNILAQTSTWLDLRDVKDIYERVHIAGVTNILPGNGFLASSFVQDNWVDSGSDEDTNIVVFVHGWRMGEWEYENFSETMFKRLYWQGYHGRFASVRWPTLSADDFQPIPLGRDYLTYNRSEFRAWESAKGVSDYLTNLKQRLPNYSLNVCAHSMGNVVMAEALKLQLAAGQHNVRNYVLMQAAVPASCYDTSFTNYAPMLAAEASQPTPNTYRGYPGSIGGAVNGHLVDFYNANDYALATGTIINMFGIAIPIHWEANQENFKPDAPQGYRTDGTNCANGFNVISDPREIMSFCARPRSKAVGAQSGVGGAVQGGSVDLHANFGFDLGSDQHSAQFNWNIQQVSGFYRQLGISLGVFQPSTP
ncbi:MAG: hypothetical protein JWR19_389 [Pedosphaera sp.]|nr:hypothetical protein [Pedosphaera sp.]